MRLPNPRASTSATTSSLTASGVHDLELGIGAPLPSCEVRHVHRPALAGVGWSGEVDERAERHRVVHVHVGGLAFTKALDEAIVLHVVHPAMPGTGRALVHFTPERM